MIQTRFKEGSDGKTAWERMKGKRCDLEVVPFGEKVWYKKLAKPGSRKNVMNSQWEEGIWLGHMSRTTEVVIGTAEGVVKAWKGREQEKGRGEGQVFTMASAQRRVHPHPTCHNIRNTHASEKKKSIGIRDSF